jgi:hypothetical protein
MPKPALKASPGLTGEIDAFREKLQAELDRRVELERLHLLGAPRGAIKLCLTRRGLMRDPIELDAEIELDDGDIATCTT